MIAPLPTVYAHHPPSDAFLLGQTIPALLDQAGRYSTGERAFNQWRQGNWQSLSHGAFRRMAEEVALGLQHWGLHPQERVALLMDSDLNFAIADMGCLLAGLVDVPIDLTQTVENILFILEQVETSTLILSSVELLQRVGPYLATATTLKTVIVVTVPEDWPTVRDGFHKTIPAAAPMGLLSLTEVQRWGQAQWSPQRAEQLRRAIAPSDLATILYIASETQRPKGVMLTHGNITANVLAAFSSYPDLQTGTAETALLFLPLTHIFARVFLYGHLAWGHRIYFSSPNHLFKHLQQVRPTVLITVPRLLEKVYERILHRGHRLQGFDQRLFQWALTLAQKFDVDTPPRHLYGLQRQLADRLVFQRWRSLFGGRLKACISGGACLSAHLVRVFSAAGIPLLQGYGLTETSGVVCYTRPSHNRAGTVGLPIPGADIRLAADGEVLIRAPFVMAGYYRDPAATVQALDGEGWLHTGDLGHLDGDGFLTLTGVKKALFKLSTGKYVSPLPLEAELQRSPWVAHAVTVGAHHKFCGMVIFPNLAALRPQIERWGLTGDFETTVDRAALGKTSVGGKIPPTIATPLNQGNYILDAPRRFPSPQTPEGEGLRSGSLSPAGRKGWGMRGLVARECLDQGVRGDPNATGSARNGELRQSCADWLHHPRCLALYQALIDAANCHLPYWSTVRKFALMPIPLSATEGLLAADGSVNRIAVWQHFAAEIAALYGNTEEPSPPVPSPTTAGDEGACPTVARSLLSH